MIIINFLISSLNNFLSYIVEEFITSLYKLIKSFFSLFKSAFGGYLFLSKNRNLEKSFFRSVPKFENLSQAFYFFYKFFKIVCKFWDIEKKFGTVDFFHF